MTAKREHDAPTGYEIGKGEDGLTNKEREVLELVKHGNSRQQIATALGFSRQRASQYVKSLTDKGYIEKPGTDPAEQEAENG